jgi:hypothetical protein
MPPHTRPRTPAVRPGLWHSLLPERRADTNRGYKFPCAIFLLDLVFENVRQRVGCVSVCSPSEMSVAVEHGRFLLTAEQLRSPILLEVSNRSKYLVPPLSGGHS